MKGKYIEGKEATERFEKAMKQLFRAPKPPKHEPKKREALVRSAIEGIIDSDLMQDATDEQDKHRATLKAISDRFEDVEAYLNES